MSNAACTSAGGGIIGKVGSMTAKTFDIERRGNVGAFFLLVEVIKKYMLE